MNSFVTFALSVLVICVQVGKKKEICSISCRSRVLAHRPCPKTRDVLPIGFTTFVRLQQSSYGQSPHEFENRLEIRAGLPQSLTL